MWSSACWTEFSALPLEALSPTAEVEGAAPAKLPGQMGELCTSMTVLGAMASAHFHRLRTGEGQQVNLSLQSAAVWSTCFLLPLCYNKSLWATFRQLNTTDTEPLVGWDWMNAQVPLYGNYKTKDGAFICLTPVSAPRLMKHAKAMGLLLQTLCRLFYATASAKLTGGDRHYVCSRTNSMRTHMHYFVVLIPRR